MPRRSDREDSRILRPQLWISHPIGRVLDLSARQQNDLNDAEAIAETVERPTIKFVATKTGDHDLQAMHRVCEPMPASTPH